MLHWCPYISFCTVSYINKKFWEEFAYFPSISHLFEVPEPNLMELNISELTLTSLNSNEPNLTKFTAVNNTVKVKSKAVPLHTMEALGGEEV
jgi:hypothetical protein